MILLATSHIDLIFPLHSYKSSRSRSSTIYSYTTSSTISMATKSPSQSCQGGANKKSAPLPQKATVISLAGVEQSRTSAISSIDHSILERIKKCLSRANHPNTAELEAKTAWHMASRLMAQHNVTQADVLAQVTNDEDLAQMGGESIVGLTNPSNPTRVITRQWVRTIASAMSKLFDCSTYWYEKSTSVRWVFYGIAANTVPAAMAFEMAHNLTLEWAKKKKGPKYDYCMGMGDGLWRIACDEKEAEVKRAKEAEQAEVDADCTPTPAATWSYNVSLVRGAGDDKEEDTMMEDDDPSDDEDFHLEPDFKEVEDKPIDVTGDFEDQLRRMVPKGDAASSPETLVSTAIGETPNQIWFTSQALVHFRQSAKMVAEEYLKAGDTKPCNSRKRNWTVKNTELYEEGIRDSKDVDVKRRRIEASK